MLLSNLVSINLHRNRPYEEPALCNPARMRVCGQPATPCIFAVFALVLADESARYASDAGCSALLLQTGICNVYFVDTTPTMNSLQATMGLKEAAGANPGASTRKGICVECKTECDCEANQFCGARSCAILRIICMTLQQQHRSKCMYISTSHIST